MLPFIYIGSVEVPMFAFCVSIGAVAFTVITFVKLKKRGVFEKEVPYIIPKIFIAAVIGYVGALVFDALVKIPENGGFKISGLTFYGGIICGALALSVEIKFMHKNTDLSLYEWLNFLTVPFLTFHFFGRLGCFLGGCCYGKKTDGFFGVLFPDRPDAGIYHNGFKVYPTQLFEAIALLILIIFLLIYKKRQFAVYCFVYPTVRFLIEFLRGDDRGLYFAGMSPSQIVSLIIVIAAITVLLIRFIKRKKNLRAKI